MAKRSATECSSILDILRHLRLIDETMFVDARTLLVWTVAMLIRVVQKTGNSGTSAATSANGLSSATA